MGVGEVWECPKRGIVVFQIETAVLRILIGLGEVVAHLNIVSAFG
jgi:hypothetical protein